MKCLACDKILSDKEATRKYDSTGDFVDLCDHCIKDTGINYTDNPELRDENDFVEEDFEEECFINYEEEHQ